MAKAAVKTQTTPSKTGARAKTLSSTDARRAREEQKALEAKAERKAEQKRAAAQRWYAKKKAEREAAVEAKPAASKAKAAPKAAAPVAAPTTTLSKQDMIGALRAQIASEENAPRAQPLAHRVAADRAAAGEAARRLTGTSAARSSRASARGTRPPRRESRGAAAPKGATTMKNATTRARGRPPVDDADRREYVRAARLTRAEADLLAELAARLELTEGDVLRRALAAYAARKRRELA